MSAKVSNGRAGIAWAAGVSRRDAVVVMALLVAASMVVEATSIASVLYILLLLDGIPESRNLDSVGWLTLVAVAVFGLGALAGYLRSTVLFLATRWVERRLFLRTLQGAVRFGRTGRPELAGTVLQDFAELRRFAAGPVIVNVLSLLASPILLAFMFAMHWTLGVTTVIGMVIIAVLGYAAQRLARPQVREAQKLEGQARSELLRRLGRNDEVIGLGMVPAILARWSPRRAMAMRMTMVAERRSHALESLGGFAEKATITLLFLVSSYIILHDLASPMTFIASHMMIYRMVGPYHRLASDWLGAARALNSYASMARTLAEADEATLPADAPDGTGLVVRGADVVVPGSDRVLVRQLYMELLPGTVCSVVGANGTGKTSLLRSVTGLMPLQAGQVLFDGQDMHTTSRLVLGPQVGLLTQRPQLLDGTVAENIARFHEDVSGAVAAARLAGAHEMIGRLPRGYSTPAGPGAGLSGGQQRQVALARALYGEPRLVLLDEPETNLDRQSQLAVVEAVRALRKRGAVVMLVTHDAKLWTDVVDCELALGADAAWELRRPLVAAPTADAQEAA